MTEKWNGPRPLPDRILGPNNHPLVWYVMLFVTGTAVWVGVFVSAWWVFKR